VIDHTDNIYPRFAVSPYVSETWKNYDELLYYLDNWHITWKVYAHCQYIFTRRVV